MKIINALLKGRLCDVTVCDGIITAVEPAAVENDLSGSSADAVAVVDAGGRTVIPGMIDPHVHLRCPGMEQKEDWSSGSRAALAGGVTTVIDMPNTIPPTETLEALELKRRAARSADAAAAEAGAPVPRRLFWAGCSPEHIESLPELLAEPDTAGVKLFFSETSANASSSDVSFISDAMSVAAAAGKPVAVHSELGALLNSGAVCGAGRAAGSEGVQDKPWLVQHNLCRPAGAAVAGTALALELAAVAGCRLYLCHLSTLPEFAMVRKYKEAYGPDSVIAELTPHHLLLDETHIVAGGHASWAKVNPPLRSAEDRKAAAEALLDGTADLIGSDHAPHQPAEKDMGLRPFHECPSGFPGLETELGLVAGLIDNEEVLIRLTNSRAAEVFGLEDRNGIAEGKLADIVILDGPSDIDASSFKTKAKYSPFNGMKMPVSVYKTIVGGKVIEQ